MSDQVDILAEALTRTPQSSEATFAANGSIHLLNGQDGRGRTSRFWSSLVCSLLDHEVPVGRVEARAESTHWLAVCARCGKPTRI